MSSLLHILEKRVATGELPNKILFTGISGVGKSRAALHIANLIGNEIVTFNMSLKSKIPEYLEAIFKYERDTTFILEEIGSIGDNDQIAFNEYLDHHLGKGIHLIGTTADPDKMEKGFYARFRAFELEPFDLEETIDFIEEITEGQLDKKTSILIYNSTDGNPRAILGILDMKLDSEELNQFIKFVDTKNFLELFESMKTLPTYVAYLNDTKLNKQYIRSLRIFIQEVLSYREGYSQDLSKEEKQFVSNTFAHLSDDEFLILVDAVGNISWNKEDNYYKFLRLFKLFNKVPTAVEEKRKSEEIFREAYVKKSEWSNEDTVSSDSFLEGIREVYIGENVSKEEESW